MSKHHSKRDAEHWMNSRWRPAMGWVYMATCITDFIIFPVLWAIFQAHIGKPVEPWQPLTLQGAGLFHLAMGAVLGVAAWSRGQEKIAGVNGGMMSPMMPSMMSNSSMAATSNYSGYGQSYDYTSQTPASTTGRTFTSKQGKPGPVIEEPEL